MPSAVPGYEYDIFISYRQNDNHSGWVTEFVTDFREELAATIKEPLSVYFDSNPHDGLLETHHVNKSLEGKLKCLIFIPILSHTYCDAKAFAWKSEFCAFNKLASEDKFGREIRVANGNVSSRILPVKIHDLDATDKAVIERETGSPLRAIEFIYKSPGVNRPLLPSDDKEDNLNRTVYRDQLNKLANSVKEILNSLKGVETPSASEPETVDEKPGRRSFKLVVSTVLVLTFALAAYFLYPKFVLINEVSTEQHSIAVLSFVDMSPEKNQEYLGDGIAEEIINMLTRIEGLKVIGRTSSFSFKGKDVDLKSIGETLGAKVILTGSVKKSGKKIRVTVQLLNATDERTLWSERYDRELEDIFAIQDDIASEIVRKLRISLDDDSNTELPSTNIDAYEALLRARHFRSKGIDGLDQSLKHYEEAGKHDPTFALAHAEASLAHFYVGLFDLENQRESFENAKAAAEKAISIDPSNYQAYNMLSVLNYMVWEWDASLRNYERAVTLGLPLPDQWHAYYEMFLYGPNPRLLEEALHIVERDPLSVDARVHLSRIYLYMGRYEDVIANAKRIFALSPEQSSTMRHVGEAYMFSDRPKEALPYFKKLFEKDFRYSPHNYVAVLCKLGQKREALDLFQSMKDSIGIAKKAACYLYLGETDKAFQSFNEAIDKKDANMAGFNVDPHSATIRNDPRYDELLRKMKIYSK